MEGEQRRRRKRRKKKKNLVPIIAVAVVIIALLAVIGVLLAQIFKPEEKRNVVITRDTVSQAMSQMMTTQATQEQIPTSYETRMNTTWNFDNGTAVSSDAYVENATSNSHAVYFDVQLADTGETILESPVIPVGARLNNIALDKDLEPGLYDAVVIYHLVNDKQETLATLRVAIDINVKN